MTSKQVFRQAQLQHARHYADVWLASNYFYRPGGDATLRGVALLDQEWDNIQAGQAWAAANAQQDATAAQLCGRYSVDGGD